MPNSSRSQTVIGALALAGILTVPRADGEVTSTSKHKSQPPIILFDEEFNTESSSFLNGNNTDFPRSTKADAIWNVFHYAIDPNSPQNPQNYFLLKDTITVAQGVLHITANNKPFMAWPKTHPHSFSYTSGRIETAQYFTHGFFEIRARIPTGQGFWPGLWLFSKDRSAEIDIVEGHGISNTYASNTIYWKDKPKTVVSAFVDMAGKLPMTVDVLRGSWNDLTHKKKKYVVPARFRRGSTDPTGNFHIFGLDWQAQGITFYRDGQPYFRTTRTLRDPMRLIIGFALGGPGGNLSSSSSFPASLDIDYVRVYDAVPNLAHSRAPTLKLGPSPQDSFELPPEKLEADGR